MKLIAPASEPIDGQVDAEDPEVLADGWAVRRARERRVRGPARAGGAAFDDEAREDDEPAEEEEPERERVQARERHVGGADHERHEVVPEAGEDRDDEEEDHRRPVDREELVVGVARDELLLGLAELEPHQHRHDAAGEEEEERRDDVEDPDPLVVEGHEPLRDRALLPGRRPCPGLRHLRLHSAVRAASRAARSTGCTR